MSPLIKVTQHIKNTGISPTRFGREAANDPRLVHDLRSGRQVGAPLWRRIESYMARTAASRPSTVPSLQASRRSLDRLPS